MTDKKSSALYKLSSVICYDILESYINLIQFKDKCFCLCDIFIFTPVLFSTHSLACCWYTPFLFMLYFIYTNFSHTADVFTNVR